MGSFSLCQAETIGYGGLHVDAKPDSAVTSALFIHTGTGAPYEALFAIPTGAGMQLSDSDMKKQSRLLWKGQADPELWSAVRTHQSDPDKPIIFDGLQTAHDFQMVSMKPRSFSRQQFNRRASAQAGDTGKTA
jgi:hypothetical protein